MNPPVTTLLGGQILTGENYATWKSNMNLLLITWNYQFVLKGDRPREPGPNAPKIVLEEYNHWTEVNNIVRFYLLANMNKALSSIHEKLETAYEIMKSLQLKFGTPSFQAHYEAIKGIMNGKMKSGSSVRAHVLNMISHLTEAEFNGARIDHGTQVVMILETLSSDFIPFKNNYVLNHKRYNMTELLNALEAFESLIGNKGGQANVVEANVITQTNMKRKLDETEKSIPRVNKEKVSKKSKKEEKPKGTCFHCGQDGHWLRNCKKYLEELPEKRKQDKLDMSNRDH